VASKAGRGPRDRSGASTGQERAVGSTGPGLSASGVKRGLLAVAVAVGLIAFLGPYRHQTGARITSLRQRIIPKPSYIDGERAVSGPQRAPVPALTDKVVGADEFTSDQVTQNPSPTQTPPLFSVELGKDGDLNKPVNLFKVGIVAGVVGQNHAKHPSPHHVLLAAIGKDGHLEKATTLDLHDNSSFQSFPFSVKHVSRVDFYVVDTYGSPDRQGPYVVDEVEFFALT
jgi:hypothetical protein